jgi:hypothetical protein
MAPVWNSMDEQGFDVDRMFDNLTKSLEAKRKAIDATLAALDVLRANAKHIAPDVLRAAVLAMREADVVDSSGDSSEPLPLEEAPERENRTVYQRVRDFFVLNGNRPATNAMIRRVVRASRGTVAVALYNTHRHRFDQIDNYVGNKKAWKLKDDFYARILSCPTADDAEGGSHVVLDSVTSRPPGGPED